MPRRLLCGPLTGHGCWHGRRRFGGDPSWMPCWCCRGASSRRMQSWRESRDWCGVLCWCLRRTGRWRLRRGMLCWYTCRHKGRSKGRYRCSWTCCWCRRGRRLCRNPCWYFSWLLSWIKRRRIRRSLCRFRGRYGCWHNRWCECGHGCWARCWLQRRMVCGMVRGRRSGDVCCWVTRR